MQFELHERLATDTTLIKELAVSQVLLMEDARFPWVILVPRIAGLRELHDLKDQDAATVLSEINLVSRALSDVSDAHKMNVAALGNQVPQLHIHVIARQLEDAAWPNPVWGIGSPEHYDEGKRTSLIKSLSGHLA